MTINNRVCLVPGVNAFRASPASYYGTAAVGGAAGGPAGSSSMVFFCLMYLNQLNLSGASIFGRQSRSTPSGWEVRAGTGATGGVLSVMATNSTPAQVVKSTASGPLSQEGQRVPYLIMGSYQNGTMDGWVNGVSMGAPVTLGAGYSAYAGPTTLGVRSNTAAEFWTYGPLADCGLLDAYDVAAYVDPIFGNGGPGLSARWLADLRQGRYLTWPRAAVANSDWYWAARDAVLDTGLTASWTDRFSATSMLRFGQPQPASFPARPI